MKTRLRPTVIFEGKLGRACWIVECQHGKQWLPLGDNGQISRFANKAEAKAAAAKVARAIKEGSAA